MSAVLDIAAIYIVSMHQQRSTTVGAATLSGRLKQQALEKGESPFCSFIARGVTEEITFAQVYDRSLAYARTYAAVGVEPGDVILVILQHTPHQFYAYLGAILAGAVPSFMPYPTAKQRADLYWKDHEALFERIAPKLIVTYEQNRNDALATLPNLDVPILVASDDLLEDRAAGTPTFAEASPDDIACLQHSSGTTSLKKGVMLTHRAICDEVRSYGQAISLTEGDVIASWLPLYHDMGFIAVFMTSVVEGTHWVALDPFEWVVRPSILLDAIARYRATLCWLPNFAFSHLANTARPGKHWDLSTIRAFINCSEPCKSKTFDRFVERFAESGITHEKLHVCYAMAENVFAVTQTPPGGPARRLETAADALAHDRIADAAGGAAVSLLSCGEPVDGVELRVVDADGRDLPERRVGEIAIRSPFLFSGYYRLPEKTAQRLRDGWYYSGDMGFLADGELFVTGRVDDMLITNGRNYYAHEIEHVVNDVHGVLPGRNVAIGLEDVRTDATVVVVLAECREDADLDKIGADVKRDVLERLGLAIHALVPLTKGRLVKTTSGKISRNKNKELYIQGAL